jgi:Short C-terminal domain
MKRRSAVLAMLLAAACAKPGTVVQLSPDTYMVSRTDKGGVFGSASAMKVDAIREASEFAAGKGKVAIPLHIRETPAAPGGFASVEYQFRVLDKSDPEARRVSVVPRSDAPIEKTEKAESGGGIDVRVDVYGQLIKLDELRRRGILTEAEFDAQKRKLLGEH